MRYQYIPAHLSHIIIHYGMFISTRFAHFAGNFLYARFIFRHRGHRVILLTVIRIVSHFDRTCYQFAVQRSGQIVLCYNSRLFRSKFSKRSKKWFIACKLYTPLPTPIPDFAIRWQSWTVAQRRSRTHYDTAECMYIYRVGISYDWYIYTGWSI